MYILYYLYSNSDAAERDQLQNIKVKNIRYYQGKVLDEFSTSWKFERLVVPHTHLNRTKL